MQINITVKIFSHFHQAGKQKKKLLNNQSWQGYEGIIIHTFMVVVWNDIAPVGNSVAAL